MFIKFLQSKNNNSLAYNIFSEWSGIKVCSYNDVYYFTVDHPVLKNS